jgi:hypothetical protein
VQHIYASTFLSESAYAKSWEELWDISATGC